ncbi:MAG: hypothetical protein ACYSVY_05200 [Planctomycetota bacterium]|jgi:hypothetical protein
MAKKPARRPHGGVPFVEIDGVKVTAKVAGREYGLKRRPEPDGRYYVVYRDRPRPTGRWGTKYKTFGTDAAWAIYRFVCWRERIERRYRRRIRRRRRIPTSLSPCPQCGGSGYV